MVATVFDLIVADNENGLVASSATSVATRRGGGAMKLSPGRKIAITRKNSHQYLGALAKLQSIARILINENRQRRRGELVTVLSKLDKSITKKFLRLTTQ